MQDVAQSPHDFRTLTSAEGADTCSAALDRPAHTLTLVKDLGSPKYDFR